MDAKPTSAQCCSPRSNNSGSEVSTLPNPKVPSFGTLMKAVKESMAVQRQWRGEQLVSNQAIGLSNFSLHYTTPHFQYHTDPSNYYDQQSSQTHSHDGLCRPVTWTDASKPEVTSTVMFHSAVAPNFLAPTVATATAARPAEPTEMDTPTTSYATSTKSCPFDQYTETTSFPYFHSRVTSSTQEQQVQEQHQQQHMQQQASNTSDFLMQPTKRRRLRVTRDQLLVLETRFGETRTPSPAENHILAKQLGIPYKSVLYWFQNRRAQIAAGNKKSK
ncbi:hypothetical protein BC830DRAFT_442535 [Chytriomyces sp. MP71]|nr:hypothetical protein BC830DRAFT_442535 [Chytriomyces sp. MP71]